MPDMMTAWAVAQVMEERTRTVLRAAALWLQDTHAEKADEILHALEDGGVTDELVAWAEVVIATAKGGE